MNMEMHMLGGMYAPSDNLTIMLMTNYIKKKMSHTTYNMGGTAVVGEFEAETKGIGDTSITAMINSKSIFNIKSHLNIGLSLPTGSVTETVEVLMPNSSRPTIRAPYGMQLGSGTYDLKGAFTINKDFENFGYTSSLPIGDYSIKKTLNLNEASIEFEPDFDTVLTLTVMLSFVDATI